MRPSAHPRWGKLLWTAAGVATLIWASSAPARAQAPEPTAPIELPAQDPTLTPAQAVQAALERRLGERREDDEVAAFYRARGGRPLWIEGGTMRPEARRLVDQLQRRDDPAAADLDKALSEAASGDPDALATAELALSDALASEAVLRTSKDEAEGLAFVDPELAARWGGGRPALQAAAASPDLAGWIDERLGRRNPLYEKLAEGLERYRASWGALPDVKIPAGPELAEGSAGARVRLLRQRLGLPADGGAYDAQLGKAVAAFQRAHGLEVTGKVDAGTLTALNAGPWAYEQHILANMERAKALPPTFGDRYILVDAAVGELWFYDHGEVAKSMKVVVGKPGMATPMMAGLLRYAVFNPYWNVPEDLVRTSIAPKALAQGPAYFDDQNMEVLSDYTDSATVLDPAAVDWKAVERGDVVVRVRQKPGPKNMMGQVKLAFPNPLGIYLHDTPLKELFEQDQRTASSGCVRLEDAMSLAELLVGDEKAHELVEAGAAETATPLAEPVPVFITYLTAAPAEGGFQFRPDVYGRDKAWRRKVAMADVAKVALVKAEAARVETGNLETGNLETGEAGGGKAAAGVH